MKLKELIDRGLHLVAQIDAANKELAEIEERITKEAIDKPELHVALVDERREGRMFMAIGSAASVPVVFTADKLINSLKFGAAVEQPIRMAAGEFYGHFYAEVHGRQMLPRSGKAFRKLADELLGAKGPALVTASLSRDKHGIPRSDIRIEWDRANVLGA